MLYIIGLGLGDEQDITEKGAAAIRSSDKIFLESYTAILPGARLVGYYWKPKQFLDKYYLPKPQN